MGPDGSAEELFAFVRDVAEMFGPFYTEVMRENHALSFGAREEAWQTLRRNRYAEFNLAFDRGTRFGLETGGRTESILMSLPPAAAGPTTPPRPPPARPRPAPWPGCARAWCGFLEKTYRYWYKMPVSKGVQRQAADR